MKERKKKERELDLDFESCLIPIVHDNNSYYKLGTLSQETLIGLQGNLLITGISQQVINH